VNEVSVLPGIALPTTAELTDDPHPALARLRERDPVCWLPSLGAWLVTSHRLATKVLRDAATFTVDDPRFTTAQVTGPSMLSLDGAAHARHRAPFAPAFRPTALSGLVDFAAAEAARLTEEISAARSAELRSGVAGPLAAAVMTRALGLTQAPATVLAWYADIVAAVSDLAGAGGQEEQEVPGARSFAELAAAIRASIRSGQVSLLTEAAEAETAGAGRLSAEDTVANAAVLLFGGIDTTEGMILNAVWHLLSHPAQLGQVRADPALLPGAIEESLRLEPAAAVVDRYATRDVRLGGAAIRAGDPVTVSITGANRDPAVFAEPDRYDIRRVNVARHLAFAHGPHFCLGAHLARAETTAAVRTLLGALPRLRLDPGRPAAPHGLIFRKPPALYVRWD
jgi:cytochrome P450